MRLDMAKIDFERASQAEKGHGVRWVLGISLAAAALVLLLVLAGNV
jgi:hypothetical protein